jgi:hypothetical protein
MRRQTILIAGIFCIILFEPARADIVYIDDGLNHLVNDNIYETDEVFLDFYTANEPGTHLELTDSGTINWLFPYKSSTVVVSGGLIRNNLEAFGNSTVNVSGGSIAGDLTSYDSSIVEVTGGSIVDDLFAWNNGTIYIYGTDFKVDGQDINYGDSLRDYGTYYGAHSEWLRGIVTGTLQDGSSLNNDFFVRVEHPNASIIVIPEPVTLLLLALGAVMLRKRR